MKLTKKLRGKLLIATPSILDDPSFNRSIILLTEHSEDSSLGFILNRKSQFQIKDLLPDIDCDFPVYNGGPVENDNIYFIHNVPHLIPNSIEVTDGIFWGGSFSQLKELLNRKALDQGQIRFFLGYAGWSPDQLENELEENAWLVRQNTYSNILDIKTEELWKNNLLSFGRKYTIWANAPSDPKLN